MNTCQAPADRDVTCADRAKVVIARCHKFLDEYILPLNKFPLAQTLTGRMNELVKHFALVSRHSAYTEHASSLKKQVEFRTRVQVR